MAARRANGPNVVNRTIFTNDNLHVMRGLKDESVDLIYLDPPFNSNHDYAAPIGSEAAGAEFKDTWTLSDIDEAWWGEIEDDNEALYKVLDAAGSIGGGGKTPHEHKGLPHLHGSQAIGDAQDTKGHRKPVPPLRPDHEPLPEMFP